MNEMELTSSTGFEIRALEVKGRARYFSSTHVFRCCPFGTNLVFIGTRYSERKSYKATYSNLWHENMAR